MCNWWQGTVLALTTILATLNLSVEAIASAFNSQQISSSKEQQIRLLAQKNQVCARLATNHSKIYAFETQNFCIAICQADDEFFYLRQSRTNPEELSILPATAVFGGTVFQAIDGKTVYFVGIDANGHYSSVMRNDDEIVFEPEIQPATAELPNSDDSPVENLPMVTSTEAEGIDSENIDNFDEEDWKICDRDKNQSSFLMNSWQKFLNASVKIADSCQTQSAGN